MTALSLSILAFAAGVFLLIKVKKEYLGGVFSALAWFVIFASFVSIGFSSVKTVYHFCKPCCKAEKECIIEKKRTIYKSGKCCLRKESCSASFHKEADDSEDIEACKRKCAAAEAKACCASK